MGESKREEDDGGATNDGTDDGRWTTDDNDDDDGKRIYNNQTVHGRTMTTMTRGSAVVGRGGARKA
jgi:hypothetical protein